jgi:hypothetical protein
MILELPNEFPPHLYTITRIAHRAAVSRQLVLRQIALGLLVPDAFVELGETMQPVFREKAAVEVLKNATGKNVAKSTPAR